MSVRQVSKYRDRRSRTSSESRDSDRVVKPTRSANRTETSRRSAAGSLGGGWPMLGRREVAAVSPSAAPHSPKNFRPGGLGCPQTPQRLAMEAQHSPQNF